MQDHSRGAALGAFLVAVTALWLPWWRVAWDDGNVIVRESVFAFRPEAPLTTTLGPWLTGALCGAAALLLFVRLAGESRRYELHSWRRDLWVAAGLLIAAAATCVLWPLEVPYFWGARTYTIENATGPSVTQDAMPGLAWWLALVSAGLLVWAAVMARQPPARDPSTMDVATPK